MLYLLPLHMTLNEVRLQTIVHLEFFTICYLTFPWIPIILDKRNSLFHLVANLYLLGGRPVLQSDI